MAAEPVAVGGPASGVHDDDATEPGAVVLANERVRVACVPARGFVVTAVIDAATGANALWSWPGREPAPASRALGPGGAASVASFLDGFAGGWFEQAPAVGFPADDDPDGLLHGELCRLPWSVTAAGDDHVEAEVRTVRTPLHAAKRISLAADGTVAMRLALRNESAMAVSYALGTHPCFARATFAGGTIVLDAAAAHVPDPPLAPGHGRLLPGVDAAWPTARGATGEPVDLAAIPAAPTETADHVCVRPAAGRCTLTAPALGRALTLAWELAGLPHVLIWQDFGARSGAPLWGAGDVLAIEPSTNPGRTMADLAAAGAQRLLAPGATVSTTVTMRWHD